MSGAQGQVRRADRSNDRWATDVTDVFCGRDGWAHLAVVLDCHDREWSGWEFARRGRAKEAERALEEACLEVINTASGKTDFLAGAMEVSP